MVFHCDNPVPLNSYAARGAVTNLLEGYQNQKTQRYIDMSIAMFN